MITCEIFDFILLQIQIQKQSSTKTQSDSVLLLFRMFTNVATGKMEQVADLKVRMTAQLQIKCELSMNAVVRT